jgi:hypothetical protein
VTRFQADYFRAGEMWGQYWNNVPTQPMRPGEGTLVINIGTNAGIRKGQYLYGFETQQDGSAVYRGDFVVDVVSDVQAQVKPNWVIRPEDVQTWQQGNWRWRNLIPPGNQPVFDQQTQAIARALDTLSIRQQKLVAENTLEMKHLEMLKQREAELVGGDTLSKDPAVDPEFRDGLVPAIEQAEETRNQTLRKVDELRRRVRAVQHDVDQRTLDNVDLTRKLPQAPAVVGAAK